MKRLVILILMFFIVLCFINAQGYSNSTFDLNFIWGDFGGGMNLSSDQYNYYFSVGLFDFFIEHNNSNIGIGISPLQYVSDYDSNTDDWDENLYFLNAAVYWNPFNFKNIILGPFVSINYFSIDSWSRLNTSDYIFSAGFKFMLRTYIESWRYPFQIVGTEIGYRNVSGRHGFFFSVNVDIIILAGVFTAILQDEALTSIRDYEKYKSGRGGPVPFVPDNPL